MRRGPGRRYIPRENKASANKRKEAMFARFKEYRPKCLFVVDVEGRFCGKPTVASHTISRANVLEPMMGPDKKVLVTSWGAGPYSHLFMSSSEESPIDFSPSAFKPRSQGINSASTEHFACAIHEPNTFDLVDIAEPDFTNPEVLFLVEYRTYLFAHSLLLWGRWMYDQWDRDIMRNGTKTQKAGWVTKKGQMQRLLPQIEKMVYRLGTLWFERKNSAIVAPQVVTGRLLYFRSSLKFAACMFYGRSSAITVFPTGGDWYGLGMTRLAGDEGSDDEVAAKLIETVHASINQDSYSINVLAALHDVTAGVVAMSPDSYDLLSEQEKLRIGEIIASIANADMLRDIVNSVA